MGSNDGSDHRIHFPIFIGMAAFGEAGNLALRAPEADMMAVHDTVTTTSRNSQHMLAYLVNQLRHLGY